MEYDKICLKRFFRTMVFGCFKFELEKIAKCWNILEQWNTEFISFSKSSYKLFSKTHVSR